MVQFLFGSYWISAFRCSDDVFSTFVLQWCPVYVCYFGFFVVEAIVKGLAFRWGGLGKGFGDEGQWGR